MVYYIWGVSVYLTERVYLTNCIYVRVDCKAPIYLWSALPFLLMLSVRSKFWSNTRIIGPPNENGFASKGTLTVSVSAKQKREAKEMGCPVLVKYEDGYWLHDLMDWLSYPDGEDLVRLIDSKAKNNGFRGGGVVVHRRKGGGRQRLVLKLTFPQGNLKG